MSLSTQLTRLARNVGALTADTNAIFEALRAKGVDVPANAQLSDVADMIESIVPPQTYVTIGCRQYKTVTIGNQEWLAENLDYKFQVNGSTLPIGSSGNPTTPAAWYYNNDESSYGIDGTYKCGLLYNWYAAKYLDDNKTTLLPSGWHVPNKIEWETLISYIGGTDNGISLEAIKFSVTPTFPNWSGTDNYGFNALPSGYRYNGNYYNFNTNANIFTSTESDLTNAYFYSIASKLFANNGLKTYGLTLRLVRTIS